MPLSQMKLRQQVFNNSATTIKDSTNNPCHITSIFLFFPLFPLSYFSSIFIFFFFVSSYSTLPLLLLQLLLLPQLLLLKASILKTDKTISSDLLLHIYQPFRKEERHTEYLKTMEIFTKHFNYIFL